MEETGEYGEENLHAVYPFAYLVHPHLEERESTRLVKEQLERKKNIKHLEQLFLEETAKATNRIYS